jgi:hypothetical protein
MSKITRNLIIKSCYESYQDTLENTNSIILPKDILEEIISLNQENYFFKITNSNLGIFTYVGVLEFSADENTVITPFWLYEYLAVTSSSVVEIELVNNVIKGKKVILEPLDEKFFKLPEYDAILEVVLSKFSILHFGSLIKINIMDEKYVIKINDIEHDYSVLFNEDGETDEEELSNINMDAISIINTDLSVEILNTFLKKELERKRQEELAKKELELKKKAEELANKKAEELANKKAEELANKKAEKLAMFNQLQKHKEKDGEFVPFSGKGHRLGGD